jgi:uncharacterized protein YdaU (DUF1376 family)
MGSSWFPLFGRDFLAATMGWTAEERGHYVTLLIAQWEQDGLPDDPKRLELISPGVGKAWSVIEGKFPVSRGGRRRNARLEHERHLASERSERARQSASARWSKAPAQSPEPVPAAEKDGSGCSEQCVEQCDRICPGDASMSMSYSPPTPPSSPGGFGEGWERLRTAWNAAWGEKRQWRSAEPPPDFAARAAEPGWLDEAIAAIPEIKRGLCAGFKTPPTLRQYCARTEQGTFVARMLGGEFVDPVPTRREAPV